MSELSLSLDDYASKNRGKGGAGGQSKGQRNTRRPGRGGGGPIFERTARNLRQTGRRKTPYNKPSRADGRWTNDKYAERQEEQESYSIVPQQPVAAVAAAPRTIAGDLRNTLKAQAAKLFVSNVEKQITEEELLQLFAGIGSVKSIALHFDKDGKSQGTALVNFASRASAELALSEFSGRMLDGEELLIEFVNSEAATAAAVETSVTIDPLQNIQSAPVQMEYSTNYNDNEEDDPASFWGTAAGSKRRGNRNDNRAPRRGKRQERRGNNRRNRETQKNVSAGDLDAQMEAYRSRAKKAAE